VLHSSIQTSPFIVLLYAFCRIYVAVRQAGSTPINLNKQALCVWRKRFPVMRVTPALATIH